MLICDVDMGCDYRGIPAIKLTTEYARLLNKSAYSIVWGYREVVRAHRIRTITIGKVHVDLVPPNRPDLIRFENAVSCIPVACLSCAFDFDRFFAVDKPGRRKMLLDALHEGMLRAAAHWGFDSKGLVAAHQAVADASGLYKAGRGGLRWNRRRSIAAQLWSVADMDFGETQLYVLDFDDSVVRGALLQRDDHFALYATQDKWMIHWRTPTHLAIWAEHASFVKSQRRKCIHRMINVKTLPIVGTLDNSKQRDLLACVRELGAARTASTAPTKRSAKARSTKSKSAVASAARNTTLTRDADGNLIGSDALKYDQDWLNRLLQGSAAQR
ncbi:MAG: hypothetical protein ACKVX7_14135 [Planctomycetota bacterium]